ncbi:hypothetical protein J2D73_19525 [Acetobacter sacchari]|uniref:RiboL-PSP-HEPN domain-containing protein n=1 Tax=Acetobacter sacchari TaxID=2661687 RepID=A0ABS3M1B3_9PROT|nr:hypothetical protein [Acetobacter sacchari]MBO1361976.1 hypothetical protein [Acetobacter sacchari]
MIADQDTNKNYVLFHKNILKEIKWFVPFYVSFGQISFLTSSINNIRSEGIKEKILYSEGNSASLETKDLIYLCFEMWATEVYSANRLSAFMTEFYSKIPHVKNFYSSILECVNAFFSGYKNVAITALVPVVEGVIRLLANDINHGVGYGTRNLTSYVSEIIEREKQSENYFGERYAALESFRDFLNKYYLADIKNENNPLGLNRHTIVHGTYSYIPTYGNFTKLISILDALCFISTVYHNNSGFSLLGPNETKESKLLLCHFENLISTHQSVPKWADLASGSCI